MRKTCGERNRALRVQQRAGERNRPLWLFRLCLIFFFMREARDSIYAPAGLAGSHEWEVKDGLELLSIRATTDGHRRMQFTVDRATGVSSIDMHEINRMDAVSFESHY
jgi:hypothetical protein